MTEIRFTNGCSVSRCWADHSEPELLGAFQYETQALAFATLMSKDTTRPDGVFYVVSNHYDGKIKIIRSAAVPSGEHADG